MLILLFQSGLLHQFAQQAGTQVLFRMRNADVTAAIWVRVNMVRTLCATKYPSCPLQPLDKLRAVHSVYDTH